MWSTPVSSNYPSPFYLINNDIIRLLDKFVSHPNRKILLKNPIKYSYELFLIISNFGINC